MRPAFAPTKPERSAETAPPLKPTSTLTLPLASANTPASTPKLNLPVTRSPNISIATAGVAIWTWPATRYAEACALPTDAQLVGRDADVTGSAGLDLERVTFDVAVHLALGAEADRRLLDHLRRRRGFLVRDLVLAVAERFRREVLDLAGLTRDRNLRRRFAPWRLARRDARVRHRRSACCRCLPSPWCT